MYMSTWKIAEVPTWTVDGPDMLNCGVLVPALTFYVQTAEHLEMIIIRKRENTLGWI